MDFIFDTHAHYNDKAFNEDRTTLLDSFTESGILGVINCGTDIEESKNSIALSKEYDFMYCAVGFHPEEIHKANENYLNEIKELSKHKKCVAIGEIEGVVLHTNTMADLDYEAYDVAVAWMEEHGDEEID